MNRVLSKYIVCSTCCLLTAAPAPAHRGGAKAQMVVAFVQGSSLKTVEIRPGPDGRPTGANMRRICRVPANDLQGGISISSDGRWIAYDQLRNGDWPPDVWLVRNTTGAWPRRIGRGEEPRFAPRGDRLLYSYYPTEDGDRWTQEVRIHNVVTNRPTTVRRLAHDGSWSHDGREIALIDESQKDFNATVRIVSAVDMKPTPFEQESINPWSPLISPNGRFVAYNPHMSRPKLPGCITDRKTGEAYDLPHAGEPVLDWSPDSKHLLWTRYEPDPANDGSYRWAEIWISAWNGTGARKLADGFGARFLPDGRHILFVRRKGDDKQNEHLGDLCVADMNGRNVKVLARGVEDDFDVRAIRPVANNGTNRKAFASRRMSYQRLKPSEH